MRCQKRLLRWHCEVCCVIFCSILFQSTIICNKKINNFFFLKQASGSQKKFTASWIGQRHSWTHSYPQMPYMYPPYTRFYSLSYKSLTPVSSHPLDSPILPHHLLLAHPVWFSYCPTALCCLTPEHAFTFQSHIDWAKQGPKGTCSAKLL